MLNNYGNNNGNNNGNSNNQYGTNPPGTYPPPASAYGFLSIIGKGVAKHLWAKLLPIGTGGSMVSSKKRQAKIRVKSKLVQNDVEAIDFIAQRMKEALRKFGSRTSQYHEPRK